MEHINKAKKNFISKIEEYLDVPYTYNSEMKLLWVEEDVNVTGVVSRAVQKTLTDILPDLGIKDAKIFSTFITDDRVADYSNVTTIRDPMDPTRVLSFVVNFNQEEDNFFDLIVLDSLFVNLYQEYHNLQGV